MGSSSSISQIPRFNALSLCFWGYIKCAVHGAPVNAGCCEILKNYGNMMRSFFSKQEKSYPWEDKHDTFLSILDTTISITFMVSPCIVG
jgi:hypothetical protein